MSWIYRVGLGKGEVSENVLKNSGLQYQEVEIESALREHIPETIDKPYKLETSMREDAPNFFSCSTLISYLYIFAGIWLPSLSWEKYEYVKKIDKEDLRFGDLIFAHHGRLNDRPVDHVGMYLGEGKVLDAVGYWYKGKVYVGDVEGNPSFSKIIRYGRVVDDLKERRYVIEIPDDRPDLRDRRNLLEELKKLSPK